MHNHPCDEVNYIVSEKRGGKAGAAAVRSCTDVLVPIILSKEPVTCNLFRRIVRPHLHKSIVLDTETVKSIVRGVKSQVEQGNYTPPPIIDVDVLQAFTSVDIASENCGIVLSDH